MNPLYDRGSMDPVHESGAWTGSKVGVHGPGVHVLSSTRCNSAVHRCQRALHCSQRFYSSFVALLEAILQRCSSAARFIQVYLP